MLRHLCLESSPIPTARFRRLVPHVELKPPLTCWATREGLVRAILGRKLQRCFQSAVVNRFEYILIQAT